MEPPTSHASACAVGPNPGTYAAARPLLFSSSLPTGVALNDPTEEYLMKTKTNVKAGPYVCRGDICLKSKVILQN